MADVVPIRRALLSVSDKTGLIDLARALSEAGAQILASGGTRRALLDAGIEAVEVSQATGQPEILGGRVKTLHPRIFAGILARRDVADDLSTLAAQGIEPIDLVVVNLYPFEETIARPDVADAEAIENIDIGGPSLIRAAAKNHADVAVIVAPSQYPTLLEKVRETGGTDLATRREFAGAAFALTRSYDEAISAYLAPKSAEADAGSPFPSHVAPDFRRQSTLRYGENPHQRAAFYAEPGSEGRLSVASSAILHGKELSYNNILDLDSALRLVGLFGGPAAVVLKHNNPCGAAVAEGLAEAFEMAYEGDPVSAFGGIVGLNRAVDRETANRLVVPGRFLEAILAPEFDPEALKILTTVPTWKNSVRLLATNRPIGPDSMRPAGFDLRRVVGGLLVQDWDELEDDPASGKVVTKRAPSDDEKNALGFAWRVCQAVKSNAIVLAKGRQLVGVGAGQMSRLDSVRIAVEKAGDRSEGAVLASDAFFPFRDGPDVAAAAGVRAIIQPGGSRRDAETIAACDEHGIAMIFTGRRHFRH